MGPALPVLPSKIAHGIASSLFSSSVNALQDVRMHINSSEEASEGGSGLPLTLVRLDVVKTRTPASVQMRLHVTQVNGKSAEVFGGGSVVAKQMCLGQ